MRMAHRGDVVDHVEVDPTVDVDQILPPSALDPRRRVVVVLLNRRQDSAATRESVVAARNRWSQPERVGDLARDVPPGCGEARRDPGRWRLVARRVALHEQACARGKHSIRAVGNPGDRDNLVAASPRDGPGVACPFAIVSTERGRLGEPERRAGGDGRRLSRGSQRRSAQHRMPRWHDDRTCTGIQCAQRRPVELLRIEPRAPIVEG